MKRNHWILLALLLVFTAEIAHHIWVNWGLITVHSKNLPLSQVIRSVEKQGHVTINTNMDLTQPIKMYVTNVSLAEAMETLATVTESRWRLAYIVAPDKGAIRTAVAGLASGDRPEGWKSMFVPLSMMMMDLQPDVLPDPRTDTWAVKPASEPTLQAYLTQGSRNVSASFLVPENWNPPIKSPPPAGAISKVVPKLVSAAKGSYEEVFLLQKRERRTAERGERDPNEEGGPPRGGFDPEARDERIQNEINKLPDSQRLASQREYDTWKKFREELRNLSEEERRKRMEQMMNNPDMQERMENAANQRDSRQNPDQRLARAQGYLSRMASARSAAAGQR